MKFAVMVSSFGRKMMNHLASVSIDTSVSEYWDKYYSLEKYENSAPTIPSQFAAFCALECANLKIENIVDIGCGNGRDSLFFSSYGFNVLALDQSEAAVQLLKKLANGRPCFDAIKVDAINHQLPTLPIKNECFCYYSRFFIHSLTASQLSGFFSNLSETMKTGDYFFTEYRNEKDRYKVKVTQEHLRTFFSADFIRSIANDHGLECIYDISGEKGMAKYKEDDACVTRQIFKKAD